MDIIFVDGVKVSPNIQINTIATECLQNIVVMHALDPTHFNVMESNHF